MQAWGELCFFPLCFASEVEEETPDNIANEKEMWETCCEFPTLILQCVKEDLYFDPDLDDDEENQLEGEEREYLRIKAEKKRAARGKVSTMPSKPSNQPTVGRKCTTKKSKKDEESWSIPVSMDAETVGSTSLFEERAPRHIETRTKARGLSSVTSINGMLGLANPDNADALSGLCISGMTEAVTSNIAMHADNADALCGCSDAVPFSSTKSVTSNDIHNSDPLSGLCIGGCSDAVHFSSAKSITSNITRRENEDTLSGLCIGGFSDAVTGTDQWSSMVEDMVLQDGGRGDDRSVTSKSVLSLSGMVEYVTEIIKVEDGIDDIANIVQTEAEIQGVEAFLEGEPNTVIPAAGDDDTKTVDSGDFF